MLGVTAGDTVDRAPVLWLLSPVYKDVESYLLLRANAERELGTIAHPPWSAVRFAVVDDTGGLDPDIDQLAQAGVHVIRPPFTLGHQRAIVYGLRSIPAIPTDWIATLDADGEDRPEDLPRLLAPLVLAQVGVAMRSVVLAQRTKRNESVAFRYAYRVFKSIFYLTTGTVIRTGNFAAFRGWLLQDVINHPHFDLCYSSSLLSLNLGTIFVPCERGLRYAGQSRMNFSRLIMHGLRMMMPFTDRIAIRAMIALFCFLAGCVSLSVAVLAIRLFTHLAVPGWATYTLLFGMLGSLIAIGNFVLLFVGFAQSRGFTLVGLEKWSKR